MVSALGARERVRVFCRLRPLLARERRGVSFADSIDVQDLCPETQDHDGNSTPFLTEKEATHHPVDAANSIVSIADDRKTVIIKDTKSSSCGNHEFIFDGCFAEDTTQEQVYQIAAHEIVQDVINGYNGTILAYGQTSTGKTHTMMGREQNADRGIIPRALGAVFDSIAAASSTIRSRVLMSYVEIYCERIFDLLDPNASPASLSIREDAESGVFVEGASCVAVATVQDCLSVLSRGNANRVVASTNMNAHSSRSHAVIILRVERKEFCESNPTQPSEAPCIVRISHLYLVDLAGSERVKKAMVSGRHVDELKSINLSLSALGNCIAALSKQLSHIPYRDSKLTRLLQNSLGGNAKTSLIVTITAAETEHSETVSTLKFGQRAMKVTVQARVNVVADYKALYEAVLGQIDGRDDRIQELEMELQRSRQRETLLQEELSKTQLRLQHVEFELLASKSSLENQVKLLHSQGQTPDASTIAVDANVLSRFEQEIQALVRKNEKDLEELKRKNDEQVLTYKKLANQATQEWNNLDFELAHEKQVVLHTLQELKEVKMKLLQVEIDSSDRIAELLNEQRDKDKQLHELTKSRQSEVEERAKLQQALDEIRTKLAQVETNKRELQDRMDEDFVPRETITQMEALYEGAISKLQNRVGILETKSGGKASQSNVISNQISAISSHRNATMNSKATSRSTRAVPQIGRVIPAGGAPVQREVLMGNKLK